MPSCQSANLSTNAWQFSSFSSCINPSKSDFVVRLVAMYALDQRPVLEPGVTGTTFAPSVHTASCVPGSENR